MSGNFKSIKNLIPTRGEIEKKFISRYCPFKESFSPDDGEPGRPQREQHPQRDQERVSQAQENCQVRQQTIRARESMAVKVEN
jgi:hypothetical protein